MRTTDEIVKDIRARLSAEGIHVAIQPAITTTSCYLTFDYGVLKRARVGDHPGKPKYNYRFEIGEHVETFKVIEKSFRGHIYSTYRVPASRIDELIEIVCAMRDSMVDRYGQDGYRAILDRNRKTVEGSNQKPRYRNGAWRSRRAA